MRDGHIYGAHKQPLRNERNIESYMGKAFNKIAAGLNDAIGYAEREKRKARVVICPVKEVSRSTTRDIQRDNPRTSQ
ncbi:MAG: hypothetical protein KDE32_14850 [Novosphingobium sp.]|nr:hypothetical protein [Novosphingobium sp.]